MDAITPISGRALADAAAVNETVLRTWRRDHGLPADGRKRTSYAQLLDFCLAHQDQLPAARRIVDRDRRRAACPPQPAPQAGARRDDSARWAARAARNAATEHLDALIEATRSHLQVLEHMRTAYREVDSVLVELTAPQHLND